jgi:hypothetical protein
MLWWSGCHRGLIVKDGILCSCLSLCPPYEEQKGHDDLGIYMYVFDDHIHLLASLLCLNVFTPFPPKYIGPKMTPLENELANHKWGSNLGSNATCSILILIELEYVEASGYVAQVIFCVLFRRCTTYVFSSNLPDVCTQRTNVLLCDRFCYSDGIFQLHRCLRQQWGFEVERNSGIIQAFEHISIDNDGIHGWWLLFTHFPWFATLKCTILVQCTLSTVLTSWNNKESYNHLLEIVETYLHS